MDVGSKSIAFRFPDPAASAPAAATLTGLAVLDGGGQLPMRPMYFAARHHSRCREYQMRQGMEVTRMIQGLNLEPFISVCSSRLGSIQLPMFDISASADAFPISIRWKAEKTLRKSEAKDPKRSQYLVFANPNTGGRSMEHGTESRKKGLGVKLFGSRPAPKII